MKQLSYILYLLIICSLFVQIPVYETANTGNTLSLYHVLIAVTFVLTSRYRLRLQIAPEFLFFITIAATSLVAWAVFGVTTRAVLLPIILLAFTCGYRWAFDITDETRRRAYGYVFVCVFLAIVIRNAVYFYSLPVVYSRTNANVDIFYLASGGRNIEATLLGMLSVLLIGTRWFLPSITIAFLTSVLMLSRAGLVAVVVAMLWWTVASSIGIKKFYFSSLMIGLCLLVVAGAAETSNEPKIIKRFNLSDEQSLATQRQGRLAMWTEAFHMIRKNPFGFGVGNGFYQLNKSLGMHFRENNVHNIFVELTMDGGIQSSLLFFAICITILFTKQRQLMPEHRFALAYIALGLVEFTGYDAVGWFFIGASCSVRLNRDSPMLMKEEQASLNLANHPVNRRSDAIRH